MKKVLLLLSAVFLIGTSTFAQTDLQITAINPVANGTYDSIANGDLVTFSVTITNLGPSNLNLTDTVFIDMDLEWLIGFPGYVFRSTNVASSLSCRTSGMSDIISFSFNQGVSLGQTPAGAAIPVVPNYTYLNNIKFRVYGYTSAFVLLNDPGLSLNASNQIETTGNNELNPTNVFFGQITQPTIDITATDSLICAGKEVTFTATVVNPGSNPVYQWQKNTVNVGTNSATYTANSLADNDIISCEFSSDVYNVPTTASSNGITMTVTPSVSPSIILAVTPATTVDVGDTVLFATTITNGGSNPVYKWYKNQVEITGVTTAEFEAVAGIDFISGDAIYASMTSDEACANPENVSSSVFNMTVNTVGIYSNNHQFVNLKLYPNPNKGQFLLAGNLPNAGKYTIKITNQLGQQVFVKDIQSGKTLQHEISLNDLAAGVYFLMFSDDKGQMSTAQFVKSN